MKPQLIFLGAPGSGKGTQADHLVRQWGYGHISTGNLLRDEIGKKSPLGLKVKSILDKGQLVDDDTILALLRSHCDLSSHVYIFDGMPRTLNQAVLLDKNFIQENRSKAIYFKIGFDDLMERLVNRYICQDCGAIYNLTSRAPKTEGRCDECGGERLEQRKDDKSEIISERFKVFEETMGQVLDYYRSEKRLEVIDATAEIGAVGRRVEKVIEK